MTKKERDRAKSARWRAKNLEKVRARDRAHYHANKEKCIARHKDWIARNRDKVLADARRFYYATADRQRALRRARYAADPAAHVALATAWRKANPERSNTHVAARRAKLAHAVVVLLPIEKTIIRVVYDTARFLTELTGERFHVDHIMPLARGGLHHPRNLQVLRASENHRKGAKVPEKLDMVV